MVRYADNNTRDTYMLWNLETNTVFITRDVKWEDLEISNLAETLKIFWEADKEDLLLGI